MNIDFVFLLLLFGHVVGDFYLPYNKIDEDKRRNWWWLHCAIYALCLTAVLFFGIEYSPNIISILLVLIITNTVIHLAESISKLKISFVIDQLIHLTSLIVAWFCWGRCLTLSSSAERVLSFITKENFVVILGLLILLRPTSLLIKHALDVWGFNKTNGILINGGKGRGKKIGYIERSIIFLLLIHGQYTAISYIIALKAIIRFPEINNTTDNKVELAEYYIIGTLLSVMSVIVVVSLLGLIHTSPLAPPVLPSTLPG